MVPLVAVALMLAALERRFAGRRALAAVGAVRPFERPLFTFRAPFLTGSILAAAVSLAPIAALLVEVDGGLAETIGWIGNTPFSSLASSTAAAAIMTLVAVVLGWELTRRSWLGGWSDRLCTLAFLMPSSILGVGLIAAWNRDATA
jgi:ABC-type Fe3+ transport system permease subunit